MMRMVKILSLLVVAFAGLTAPALASDAAPVVRPLSDILLSGPEYLDVHADSVVVHIETKIPVVCAAVYGVTTAYGALATDTAMGGAGQTSHHPLLSGLQPNTVYQLRLQGVGADGTLYVSDNYTFRTIAAAAAASPPGTNVALASAGARVTAVSSNYGGGGLDSSYGGNNAIDGNAATQWSSNGDGDKAWIEVDLGKDYPLTAVGLRTRTMGTSAQIESFRVVTDKGATLGPFTIPDASASYFFPVDVSARTLRYEVVTSSGGNTGAAEVDAFTK
jgi:hypothetical protein